MTYLLFGKEKCFYDTSLKTAMLKHMTFLVLAFKISKLINEKKTDMVKIHVTLPSSAIFIFIEFHKKNLEKDTK